MTTLQEMNRKTLLSEKWSELTRGSQFGGSLRLSTKSEVYAYLDGNGRRGLLFILESEPSSPPAFQVLDVPVAKRPDNRWALRVILMNQELEPLFALLCDDLAEAADRSSPGSLGTLVIGRLFRWKRLLEGGQRDRLSLVRLRGLFGELAMLRQMLQYRSPDTVIKAWVGPLGAPQDFALPDRLVEVKAVTEDARSVEISSVEQLDVLPDIPTALVLVTLRSLTGAAEHGESLDQLVTDLRATVGIGTAADGELLLRLRAAGCGDPSIYNGTSFVLLRVEWLSVAAEFPRICRANLPTAVADASYDLSIAAVRAFSVKEQTWWN